jgi:O-antigen/teichoic acid export membrane protein
MRHRKLYNRISESRAATNQAAQSVISSVLEKAAKVLCGASVSKLGLAGTEFYLAAYLGTSGYGLFSIAFALLLVMSGLCQVGLNFGVIQYLSIYNEKNDEISKASVARVALLVVLVISSLSGLVLFTYADWLSLKLFKQPELTPLLRLVACIIPFDSCNQTCSAIFSGLRKFRYQVLAQDLIRNLFFVVCIPMGLMFDLNAHVVFQVLWVGAALGTVVSLSIVFRHLPLLTLVKNERAIFRQLISFSYMLFLWQALQKTANQLMVLIAGTVLIPTDVGILALAVRFVNLLNFPQSVVNTTSPVEFARFNHLEEFSSMARLLKVLAIILSLFSMAFVMIVGLNADWIFAQFGSGYTTYGWVLQILLFVKVLDVSGGPVGQVLISCRKRRTVLVLGIVDVLLQLLFVVPMIVLFDLPGAAFGNSVRYLLILLARHLSLYRLLGLHAISQSLLVILITGGVIFVIACWVIAVIPSVIVQFVLTTVGLVAVTLLFCYVLLKDPSLSLALKTSWAGVERILPRVKVL